MRKYLIQDITPPGKKHVTHHAHKTKEAHADDAKEHKKSHATHATHAAHHVTHKTTHHTTKSSSKKEKEVEEHDEVVESKVETAPASVVEFVPPVVVAPAPTPVTTAASTPATATTPISAPAIVVATPEPAIVTGPVTITPSTPQIIDGLPIVSATPSKEDTSMSKESDSIMPSATTAPADPRSMLVDKIIDEPAKEAGEKIFPHAPSYFDDAMNADLPAKSWHYSSKGGAESHPPITPTTPRPANLPPVMPPTTRKFPKLRSWLPWVLGLIVIAGLVVAGLFYYSGVDVEVVQKKDNIPLEEKFTVLKAAKEGELSYSVIVATSSVSLEVTATEERVVTAKASGKIIVYNTQNVVQRLIKNTRFQSPSEKIYRITDSINVPKAKVVDGKTTPGSIEVTVYADEAGPDFNSEPTDFTVPGLKGSKLFDMVYARSVGPITGGASGATKSVSDNDLKQASDDLRVQLETKLRNEARSIVASWSTEISFDSGIYVDLGEVVLPSTQSSASDKAVVSQDGTIYIVTFDREELTKKIVKTLIPSYNNELVTINNLETLEVEMPSVNGKALLESENIPVTFKGTPSLVWTVDEGEIKRAILGLPKSEFNAVMSKFPTVERAVATIRPVWKTTFPLKEEDIKVNIVSSISE